MQNQARSTNIDLAIDLLVTPDVGYQFYDPGIASIKQTTYR